MYYQISLIAAFVAGMVALFAPCCISYLLPSYLGNIFKEKRHIIFMTLIYSLGIFTIMLPVVLGAKLLSNLFFRLHDYTYLFGGVFMIAVSIMTFVGIKFPMPRIAMKQSGRQTDVVSTYTLGIFSGITSACCAPVLVGVIALSSLSPTTFQALGVGVFYVLGMVTPLYTASLFIHKKNLLENPILKKKVWEVKLTKTYPVFISNIVGSGIFLITGILMIVLTLAGKLAMPEATVTKSIYSIAEKVTDFTKWLPGINAVFLIAGIYLIYRFVKKSLQGK